MNRKERLFGALAAAFALSFITLAGCGGGSGGGAGAGGRLVGHVGGLNSSGGRASFAITVSVDGIDQTTEAKADGTFALDNIPAGLHTIVARSLTQAAAFVSQGKSGASSDVGHIYL